VRPKEIAGLVFCIAATIVSFASLAAEKLEDGISTGLTRRGNLNRVSTAFSDDAIYYWIRIQEKASAKSKTRCVVTDPNGVPLIDEIEDFEEEGDEGYLFCGVDGDDKELSAGTHTFTIYLNGEKLGERTLPVEKRPFFGKLSLRKQFKWALGALAGIILGVFWMRKKLFGDKTIDKAFPEKAAASGAAPKVVIGSKVAGATAASPQATPAVPTIDDQVKGFKAKLAADPNFRLARAEDVLPIAKAARAGGDSKTAIAAVRGFDKAFPGHALIPDVFVFSAKLLAEDFRNNDMARKILEHVIARYPGHYLAQEARTYLKEMPQGA
jgi:hypothetical protein